MRTASAYTALTGGIDLVTPPVQLYPGACLFAVNYECPVTGGYRRIDGYEQLGPEVPGEGPMLGVATFQDRTYAIRKDVGEDEATLYRLNSAGDTWESLGTVHNGRHEFDEGNVTGTEGGRALYGVGGGKPFEIKGGTLTELADAPAGALFIALHRNHLFLGFTQGSIQHSGIGDATNWDAATGGAGEIGVGQTLNGLLRGRGGTLHAICRDSIQTLYGTSATDWQLDVTIPNSGGRAYSAQNLLQPYFVAERGIASLEAADSFGDFRPMQPGALIEPIFTRDDYANRIVASAISKTRAQYRIFFNDRSGIYLSPAGITTVRFPHQVAVTHSAELDDGRERLLFGDDEGRVCLMGGNTFAGEPIEAFLTLAYNNLRTPNIRKRFRRVFWDVRAGSNASISILPDYDYGTIEAGIPRREFLQFLLGGGLWDVDNWDEFSWSVPSLGQEPMNIAGTASSVNFAIYSKSSDPPHEILGYDIHFAERRRRRG